MDDELLLSGANLSEEYFTDRQDRYISFVNGMYVLMYCVLSLFFVLPCCVCVYICMYVLSRIEFDPTQLIVSLW